MKQPNIIDSLETLSDDAKERVMKEFIQNEYRLRVVKYAWGLFCLALVVIAGICAAFLASKVEMEETTLRQNAYLILEASVPDTYIIEGEPCDEDPTPSY